MVIIDKASQWDTCELAGRLGISGLGSVLKTGRACGACMLLVAVRLWLLNIATRSDGCPALSEEPDPLFLLSGLFQSLFLPLDILVIGELLNLLFGALLSSGLDRLSTVLGVLG
jgi:hypothetical protein